MINLSPFLFFFFFAPIKKKAASATNPLTPISYLLGWQTGPFDPGHSLMPCPPGECHHCHLDFDDI